MFSKSTASEALGFLVPLILDPTRFLGKLVLVLTDNAAAVQVLNKGYSTGDPWASTICRAARVVAAGLYCSLTAKWEPRRSSRGSRISDNLTHNLLEELDAQEVKSYIQNKSVRFPPPMKDWMARPGSDNHLGPKCLSWILENFPTVNIKNCDESHKP